MPLRCLIVDDNPEFGDVARRLLEGQGIMVVGVVATSAEAVQRVEEQRPDVALVDIDLGEESGFDVARRLVDGDGTGVADVILISTHAEREFADLIEASPAIGFLAKTRLSSASIQRLLAVAGGSDAASG
jgi:two-component system, NarL family, nitrate/nitrite response regulator NarL